MSKRLVDELREGLTAKKEEWIKGIDDNWAEIREEIKVFCQDAEDEDGEQSTTFNIWGLRTVDLCKVGKQLKAACIDHFVEKLEEEGFEVEIEDGYTGEICLNWGEEEVEVVRGMAKRKREAPKH